MSLTSKKVLITGASGFIGRSVVNALVDTDYEVHALVRRLEYSQIVSKIHTAIVDLSDSFQLRNEINGINPNYVIHLADSKSKGIKISDYRVAFETDWNATLNLVEACTDLKNLSCFVFLGSSDEYGAIEPPFTETAQERPINAYGMSKLAATRFLQAQYKLNGFPVVILRPTIAYGPMQRCDMFLPALIQSLISGKHFPMSLGEQTRDLVYISDIVEAIILVLSLADDRLYGQTINISSGSSIRIIDLARKTAALIGRNAVELLDVGAIRTRMAEALDYQSSNNLANVLLKWQPRVALDEGLQTTIDYFKQIKCFN